MITILFGVIAVFSTVMLLGYRKQMKSIRTQIAYIRNHDTNKLVSKQLPGKELDSLILELNELLKKYRSVIREYDQEEVRFKQTITNLSHDIRTPLTSLDGYVQLLKECEDEADRERYHQIIASRVRSLQEILEQLFLFVRLQNNAYDIELCSCNLTQGVCDVLFSFYDDFKERNIEPEVMIPDQVLMVLGHEPSIKRMIQNIIKNALDHGKDTLQLIVEEQEKYVKIQVRNGLNDDMDVEAARVFERFYKADLARSETSTGLGLSIAKELVQRMQGTIEAKVVDDIFEISVLLSKEVSA